MLHLHIHQATSLLALFAQDNYYEQTKTAGGMIAGMLGFMLLFGLLIAALLIFLFWRIFSRAGLPGPLAFAEWKVVPAPTGSPYYPSSYPPPPPPAFQPPPQV